MRKLNSTKEVLDFMHEHNNDKLVLIGYGDGCGACDMLEKMVDVYEPLKDIPMAKFKVVDCDEFEFAKNLTSVPQVIIFNGNWTHTQSGFMTPEQIYKKVA